MVGTLCFQIHKKIRSETWTLNDTRIRDNNIKQTHESRDTWTPENLSANWIFSFSLNSLVLRGHDFFSQSIHNRKKLENPPSWYSHGNTSRIALGIAHFSTLGGKTSFHYTTMLLLRMFQSPKYVLVYFWPLSMPIFQWGSIGDQNIN